MKAEDIVLQQIEKMKPEWEEAGIISFLERIKNMYLREIDHIRDIKKQSHLFENETNLFKNLINKFALKKFNDLKSYKNCITEEDIANRAMSNVNEVYNSIFIKKPKNLELQVEDKRLDFSSLFH